MLNFPAITFQEAIDYLNLLRMEHPGRSLQDIYDYFEQDSNVCDMNAIQAARAAISRPSSKNHLSVDMAEFLDMNTTVVDEYVDSAEVQTKPVLPSLVRPFYKQPGRMNYSYYQNLLTLYALIQLHHFERRSDKTIPSQLFDDIHEVATAVFDQTALEYGHKKKHVSAKNAIKMATDKNTYVQYAQRVIDASLAKRKNPYVAQYDLAELQREIYETGNSNHAGRLKNMFNLACTITEKLEKRYR